MSFKKTSKKDQNSYQKFSITSPLPYDDGTFIRNAIDDGLIKSEQDISSFRIGHYKGIEAIHCHYYLKIKKPIPNINKTIQPTLEAELAKLREGRYDGMNLDKIVLNGFKNLGMALTMKDLIKSHASNEKLLSYDGEYSLPLCFFSDYKMSDAEIKKYVKIYLEKGRGLHSRDEILNLFEREDENFEKEKIDTILLNLINNGHI